MDKLSPAAADYVDVTGVEFDAPRSSPRPLGGQKRCTAAGEGIEHRCPTFRRVNHQVLEIATGFMVG